jgi:hypothetical protein
VGNQPLSDEESTQLIVCQYPEEEEGDGLSHHSTIPEEERPDIHIAPISDTCSPEIKVKKQLLSARLEQYKRNVKLTSAMKIRIFFT